MAMESSAVDVIDILWVTAALGCDGDTVAITAATQPSLEELVGGAFPGIPRINLHNPFLAYETGDGFLAPFRAAASGTSAPFILVVEGSLPDETLAGDGHWAAMGSEEPYGQPMKTCAWIDKLAPHAWAVVAAGT